MDTRKTTPDGLTICPECALTYRPHLGERDPARMIQDQFPEATKEEREQLVTGMCSTACFARHIGYDPAAFGQPGPVLLELIAASRDMVAEHLEHAESRRVTDTLCERLTDALGPFDAVIV